MIRIGLPLSATASPALVRVPTDRAGVGVVTSTLPADPDRGVRGVRSSEVVVAGAPLAGLNDA
jgi:hypothetical protein